MNITPVYDELSSRSADALIGYAFEDVPLEGVLMSLNQALGGAISKLLELGDFTGATGQVVVLYPHGEIPAERVIVAGMGSKDDFGLEAIRRGAANAIRKAYELGAQSVGAHLPDNGSGTLSDEAVAQAAVEGYLLALYDYAGQKTGEERKMPPEKMDIVLGAEALEAVEAGIKAGTAIAAGTVMARDLVNLPPNICDSVYMAEVAQKMGQELDLSVRVLDENQIAELKMGAFLGVARGSSTPPRFIILEHNAGHADEYDSIVLVGKGITFDTGGYNLKPSEGQGTMKADMAGAAAVIGAMRAIGELAPAVHVVGLTPVVDNMISGRAYRQQEVVTASNGVTIEIGNTDAEGRMLLADALVYAARYEPAAVVDIATLTGASAIALGKVASSLFSNNECLKERMMSAAEQTGEKLWPMPLYPEYEKAIESQTADISNTGGKYGGVGSAASFLKHFISYPAWVHIDMAGLAIDAKEIPYIPAKGATGYGVRLLVEFVERW